MAKRDNGQGSSNFPPTRWVDIAIEDADKQELREFIASGKFELHECLDNLVREGYKLSFAYDSKNSCYIASLTDLVTGDRSWQAVLTARGSTPTNAWFSLAYKHFIKSNQTWLSLAMERRDFGDFG